MEFKFSELQVKKKVTKTSALFAMVLLHDFLCKECERTKVRVTWAQLTRVIQGSCKRSV